ncbi:hypothetical protein B0H17DRAFT_1125197 [Mycena rosella]|uniref:Uncharacterized protein n=1 Tax=Mycena rosella TaxID=1033263 RepID=A0AAD7GXB0_MYCRO|nr:hypothetical protein B0H17DRAFT_1125197 [Mycena rosella]
MAPQEQHYKCPECYNTLAVEIAVGGKVPGSSYIRCNNLPQHPSGQRYFYRLSSGDSSLATSSKSSKRACLKHDCASTRIDSGCRCLMCRKHCVDTGPCMLTSHTNHRRKKQGCPTPYLPRISPTPLAFTSFPPFTSLDAIHDYTMAPFRELDTYRQNETARITEEGRRLDLALGLRSPSPDLPLEVMLRRQDALQEEEDLALALRLSEEDITASAPSTSALRVLSPSPELPMGITSSAPAPALGRACTPNATGNPSAPRKHLPAPSTRLSHSAPLHITTQMNDVWITCRPFADPRLIKRFMVVFWSMDDKPHTVSFVEDCPSWPTWRVSEATGNLAYLVADDTNFELFSDNFKAWIGISADFVHHISTDSIILLRRCGVVCLDEDKTIKMFLRKVSPAHLRYDLPAQRAAVRNEYKHQRSNTSSSKEVIICDSSSDEDNGGARTRTKASKRVIHINDNTVLRSLSPLSSTPSLPSSLRASPPLEVSSPVAVSWPAGMYTVDMVAGFIRMKSDELKHITSRSDRFTIVFGKGYNSSTYNDHVRKWREAPAALRTQALDGEGLLRAAGLCL